MRIPLIPLDIFRERVYREEKSPSDWTNRHIVEQMHHEGKKDKIDSFQSISEESMVQPRVIVDMHTHVWAFHVNA